MAVSRFFKHASLLTSLTEMGSRCVVRDKTLLERSRQPAMAVLFYGKTKGGVMNEKSYQPRVDRTLIGMASLVALLWLLAIFFD